MLKPPTRSLNVQFFVFPGSLEAQKSPKHRTETNQASKQPNKQASKQTSKQANKQTNKQHWGTEGQLQGLEC